jgi:ubiquinone/menaquinone biosynthesis C-methylase UbiE
VPTATLTSEKEELPNAFDQMAEHYDSVVAAEPHYAKHMRWSAQRLSAPPRGKILDLCCGTGLSTQQLIDVYPEADITGLDASGGMLEVARRKPQLSRARFVKGDATDPSAAGCTGPYDGIFMAYGIRNIPDAEACLKNLARLLKPGARICFHEYSVRHSMRSKLAWHAHWLRVLFPAALKTKTVKVHYYLWRSVNEFRGVPEFSALLERSGFTAADVQPMDGDVHGVLHSFIAQRA